MMHTSGPGKLYMADELAGDIVAEPAVPFADPGFEAALDAEPEAWATRMVYADMLDEQGNAGYAAAQRWMAANELAPFIGKFWFVKTAKAIAGGWVSLIPQYVYAHLAQPCASEFHKNYPDRTGAELDLAQALRKARVT